MTAHIPMHDDAKKQLSKTIRSLRDEMLDALQKGLEGEYLWSVPVEEAGLDERRHVRRERISAWIDEQVRALSEEEQPEAPARFLEDVVKEAAYTWLNRLVVIRILEASGHSKPVVVTGGWDSSGQKFFRENASELVRQSETEGYATLLQLLFDELALEMPGLFGDVGLVKLVPMPAAMLRRLIEALNEPHLESCWQDTTTLGWVYQYWNDPDRELIDAKLNDGGKVEPHEIASKTQLFTEHYMVEWLLQNSLNQMWLAICKKNGWQPECERDGVLERLEARRVEWRARRETGEVELEALMPIHGDVEARWKYWVPQPLPAEVVAEAPVSLKELKLLEPSCGSGHFLVAAFELLMAFYQEEARHRGQLWSNEEIASWILEDNLYGVDIDPRAVQIAAAALQLAARNACGKAVSISHLNLVAPALHLSTLPTDDSSLVELRTRVHEDTGLSPQIVDDILKALNGADYMGTLLRIDEAISDALRVHLGAQIGLFHQVHTSLEEDSESLRQALRLSIDAFLQHHASSKDIGLRLRGEQLASGVRFLDVLREDTYHVVVGNPPYQGTSKLKNTDYIKKNYPSSKADLFACFLERGLELTRKGGVSAMVTMRAWMFIKQYQSLREKLLENYDLRLLGDFDRGAFEFIPDEVVSVVLSLFFKTLPLNKSISIQPTHLKDSSRDSQRTSRKRAAVLVQNLRFEFEVKTLQGIEGWPLIYWWNEGFLRGYIKSKKIGEFFHVKVGMQTSDNTRFIRYHWEVDASKLLKSPCGEGALVSSKYTWLPLVKGGQSRRWFEPLVDVINWSYNGFYVKSFEKSIMRAERFYGLPAIAFTATGKDFHVRKHMYASVLENKGRSIYMDKESIDKMLIYLASNESSEIVSSLNPTIDFQVSDIKKLPCDININIDYEQVMDNLEASFLLMEKGRENSIEFNKPQPSTWEYAQNWVHNITNVTKYVSLPPWNPIHVNSTPEQWVSWAFGVALGRFDEQIGLVEQAPINALSYGILFISEPSSISDSLSLPACQLLQKMWTQYGDAINEGSSRKANDNLSTWLRKRFFGEVHRQMYENAPIYFPLSSSKKSFVAYVSIHRWTSDTLRLLQADYLVPERQRLEGRIEDLKAIPDTDRSRSDEKQLDTLRVWLDELNEFIAQVVQCSEKGPLPPDAKTPKREVDARYEPVLDDGTMINAAALWPLLSPQWSYPKKWWKELALAKESKDYDWSHLAMRYFPTRVDAKCQIDPSLAVAHGCFWRYHSERAYAWELRLKHELDDADFTLDEVDSDVCREAFLIEHPETAETILADELKRREKASGEDEQESTGEEDEDDQLSLADGREGEAGTSVQVIPLESKLERPLLSDTIKARRIELGLLVDEVISRCPSITLESYQSWERGEHEPPANKRVELAKALKTTWTYLNSGELPSQNIRPGQLLAARTQSFMEKDDE